ncbi:MAG: hypothetical protein LBR73_07645 [Oscillospiraceae bacterium]|nr:hypothetical protein [Oscillospiraceae bacterium]
MLELSGFREATLRILDTVPREILYTFDPADAETYGMRFNTQFYVTPPEALLKPVPLLYDVVFCGTVKDRARAIEGIFKDCLEAGLKPHFTVCQNRSDSGMAADIEKAGSEVFSESNGWIPIYEWIDYTTDYIERLRAARAVFDCYHATQTGFSLRVMEHMFFSKKLITTNALVRQADFYNPANIFVYGEDDITTLKAWLDVPFEPVPEEIKDYYTVERWVERFDR